MVFSSSEKNNRDDKLMDESSIPEIEEIPGSMVKDEELERHLKILSARCARLEAQNILVSVQQLDLFARGTATLLSLVFLYAYWRCLSWAVSLAPVLATSYLPLLYNEQQWLQITLHPFSLLVLKCAIASAPLVRHRTMHGVDYRRLEVFAVAFIVIIRMKLARWRENMFTAAPAKLGAKFGEDTNEDAIWDANYEISARFLYVSILRLRGLWTKSAQYLSSRADFMPASYVRELKKLQDEAPATEWKDVEKMLAKAPGVLEALTEISKTPLASASIGQVHTACLKSTGEKVVFKVQHPHARTLLTDDFWSMAVISRIVTWMEPEYKFFEILMREWAVESRKELDFVSEVRNLKTAQESMDRLMTDKTSLIHTNATEACPRSVPFQVEVPRPIDGLSTNDVLVMSFCEGVRIDDLQQIQKWGLPRESVMDAVAQAFAHMMYVTDIFNGDPHAGNLLIRRGTKVSDTDGFTIVLLDWGLAKCLAEQKRVAFCQMVYAAATFDFGLLLDAFKTIGLKMKRENVTEDMEGLRFFLRDMAPREKSRKRIKARIKTDRKRMTSSSKGNKVPMESKAYPGEFFFFVRVNELLHGLGSKLNIEMSFLDVLKPYAERGLARSDYYSIKPAPFSSASEKVGDVELHVKVSRKLGELNDKDMIAGAQVCVIDNHGRILTNNVKGHMGGLKHRSAMRSDALVLGYSCTKAIAATLAHLMVEEGYLSYDDPICERVWPAFCPTVNFPSELQTSLRIPVVQLAQQWSWKRRVTLRHILTHTSGMWSALPARMTIKSMASCEECCSAFEFNPEHPEETILPSTEPGLKSEYHYMSFGWLVAGALCGAYSLRHKKTSSTFEGVYEAILKPKLSANTLRFGFRPCGGSGEFPTTDTETANINVSKILQMRREAEAVGEEKENDVMSSTLSQMRESFKGKEFLLDPRIWNCEEARVANVPAAGGRFSAMGLAHFYHDVGSGRIMRQDSLSSATVVVTHENTANELQGQTVMASSNSDDGGISLGLGYQLIRFDSDMGESPGAFGHAGVGGSIGFYHRKSGTSVGIMLNKADGDRDTAKTIVQAIADHYNW